MPTGFYSEGPPVKRIDLSPPSPALGAETKGSQSEWETAGLEGFAGRTPDTQAIKR